MDNNTSTQISDHWALFFSHLFSTFGVNPEWDCRIEQSILSLYSDTESTRMIFLWKLGIHPPRCSQSAF